MNDIFNETYNGHSDVTSDAKETKIELDKYLVAIVVGVGIACTLAGLIYLWVNFKIYIWLGVLAGAVGIVYCVGKRTPIKKFLQRFLIYSCLYILLSSNVVAAFDSMIDYIRNEKMQGEVYFERENRSHKKRMDQKETSDFEGWTEQRGINL